MFIRDLDFAKQFGTRVRGLPLRSKKITIPVSKIVTLRTIPVVIVQDSEVDIDCIALPLRVMTFKPAGGTAYTVPNTSLLKVGLNGNPYNVLYLHHEISPNFLGVGVGWDQTGESVIGSDGPSFSWTGSSQSQVYKSPTVNAFGKGLSLVNTHATTDLSGTVATLPSIHLWLYYILMPGRI